MRFNRSIANAEEGSCSITNQSTAGVVKLTIQDTEGVQVDSWLDYYQLSDLIKLCDKIKEEY